MKPEELESRISSIVDIIKKNDKATAMSYITKRENASFYPGYDRNLEEYKDNIVHTRSQFPSSLFADVAPNQTQEDADYIERTYECITNDVALEFSNTVKRAFYNGSIEWPKPTASNQDDLQDFKMYLDAEIGQLHSIKAFMSMLADEKLSDANAVCAVLPKFETKISDNGESEEIVDVNPEPKIYNTDRVLYVGDREFIIESFDKSLVRYNKKMVRMGYIFIMLDEEQIVTITQIGDYVDWKFEYSEWEHGVGTTPAVRLSGIPVQYNGGVVFRSPFNSAVPNLNLAVLDSATMLVIKRKVGYPTRVFITEACTNIQHGSQCDNGVIRWADGSERHEEMCTSCKGTGKIGVFGAQSELLIPKSTNGETQVSANEAMAYISPSVDVPKFLRDEIDQFINQAKEVLHLKAEPRGSGDISATEKNIDVKNTEAFIKPISDQLWVIYESIISFIGRMKYDDDVYDEIKPTIIPASRFDLLMPEDYLLQIGEARKAGAPEIAINSLMYNYLQSLNYSDTFSAKVFELMEVSDSLISLSPDQISLGLSRGTIQKWEAILHDKGIYLIMELDREMEGEFLNESVDKQVEMLQAKAKGMVAQTIELPPPTQI